MRVAFVIGAVAVGVWFIGEPAFAQQPQRSQTGRSTNKPTVKRDAASSNAARGHSRGIGRSVSQAARNGVHGQQLSGQVKQFQAAQGIGQGRFGGQAQGGGQGMRHGGQGGPAAGKGRR